VLTFVLQPKMDLSGLGYMDTVISKVQSLGESTTQTQCLATTNVDQISLTAPLLGALLKAESASSLSITKVLATTPAPRWTTVNCGAILRVVGETAVPLGMGRDGIQLVQVDQSESEYYSVNNGLF